MKRRTVIILSSVAVFSVLAIAVVLILSPRRPKRELPDDGVILIGVVDRVLDGNTIQVGNRTIRLNGIDAPEMPQPFGPEAKEWLTKRVGGQVVVVDIADPDKYGISPGDVWLDDNWINAELVENGLAWHCDKCSEDAQRNKVQSYDVYLQKAQRYAQRKRKRIWQGELRITPWDYRNGVRLPSALPRNVERIEDELVWVSGSDTKFHKEDCELVNEKSRSIPKNHAMAYDPCDVCFGE